MTEVDDILAHHGVKGMHWGVRKERGSSVVKSLKAKVAAKNVKVAPSHDAAKASAAKEKLNKSGIHSLSNEELQSLTTRLNLEKQVTSIKKTTFSDTVKQQATKIIADAAKQQLTKIANDAVAKQVAKAMPA
jgi:alpha-galactosidase/6-phospho-beta-glucosidase family protein